MAAGNIPTVPWFRFFLQAGEILKNPLPFHHRNFEKLGDTFRVNLGFGKSVIFSRDAGFAEYVLKKNYRNYQKSPIQTKELAKYVGRGLLTAEGEHWREQRRLIQPAFHKKHLKQLLDKMNLAINMELRRFSRSEPQDVFPVFNDLAFQTVVKSLFSEAISREEISRLQRVTEASQEMLVKELRQPYKKWWFKMGGEIQRHIDLIQERREMLHRIMEKRRQSEKREGDLLDMLLDARYEDGNAMDDEQLIDEILILFIAGHETTSNALSFTAKLLANHPGVQERIYREGMEAREKSGDLFEFIQACPYTGQVIEESLRLYPPAYFIDRVNLEEDEYNGLKIPRGSSLLFSFYEIHRDKDHWEDPEKFNPDRFSPEKAGDHSSHYFPFGAGPRKCIGSNFAMYEMILSIQQLLEKFELSAVDPDIPIKPLITLKPEKALLGFKPR